MPFSFEKEKAIVLLGSGVKWTDSKLAKKLGVSRGTIQTWKKDKEFRLAVVSEFERTCKQDQLYRVQEVRKIIQPIYKELRKRIKKKELSKLPFKDLIMILSKVQYELRNDLERLNLISSKSSASKEPLGGSSEETMQSLSQLYTKDRNESQKYLQ
jgi:transcriptional regulator with XRE-family HTH domain